MIGRVDNYRRALMRIRLQHPHSGTVLEVEAWVDTGFNGDVILSHAMIASLGLSPISTVRAELGDGSQAVLGSYDCLIDWFGESKSVEAVANIGNTPLLGIRLLQDHVLTVDYPKRTVTIE